MGIDVMYCRVPQERHAWFAHVIYVSYFYTKVRDFFFNIFFYITNRKVLSELLQLWGTENIILPKRTDLWSVCQQCLCGEGFGVFIHGTWWIKVCAAIPEEMDRLWWIFMWFLHIPHAHLDHWCIDTNSRFPTSPLSLQWICPLTVICFLLEKRCKGHK